MHSVFGMESGIQTMCKGRKGQTEPQKMENSKGNIDCSNWGMYEEETEIASVISVA